jgi:hypothetical protein
MRGISLDVEQRLRGILVLYMVFLARNQLMLLMATFHFLCRIDASAQLALKLVCPFSSRIRLYQNLYMLRLISDQFQEPPLHNP